MNANDAHRDLIDELVQGSGVAIPDERHGILCARFAGTLFIAFAETLAMEPSLRRLIVASALFHDVGNGRSRRDHHRRTFDVMRDQRLPGLDGADMLKVACIARYHGGPYPHIEHAGFGEMSAYDQRVVRRAAAIVRVAVALDASRLGLIERVEASADADGAWLVAYSNQEASVERDRLREAEGSFHVLTQVRLRTVVSVESESQ